MKKEKTESYRKVSFKSVITIVLCLCCIAAFVFAGVSLNETEARADEEAVEIMNDRFSVSVDANGYRNDFITDQMIRLQYDKQFHATDAWLNDKASSNYTIDGMDLGNYLVINGMTFNEIRETYGGKYASVDNRTNLSKGGDWTPVTVRAYPDYIYIAIHRSFTDIGAMTVGLKDGFSYVYEGTTFKVEGDLIFKSTLEATSNCETPVFVRQEQADENEHAIETFSRSLEDGGESGVYKCLRFFPLYNVGYSSTYQTRCLGDHYLYAKDYFLINDKPVNYWNIETYSSEDDYTTNPVKNSGRVFSTPVIPYLYNNGEFQIWIHSTWAARNGIDFDNIKISLDKGFPFVKSDGKVYVTANKFSAEKIDGSVYCVKDEKEITPSLTIENVSEQTDLKHLVADVTLSDGMDDIVWHLIDGYAPNVNALTKILINGKSVSKINSSTDTSGWDWSGGYGFSETNALLQKPVLILCNGGKMTIYINGQYRDLLENGKNTDVKIEILGGANVLFQPTKTDAGNEYTLAAMEETIVYKRTYTLKLYPDGADGEAVTSEVAHGETFDLSEYGKEGYSVKWTDEEGNAALGEMPERNYSIYASYTAIEYTAEVEYLSGDTETVTYTIENRAAKLADIKQKLTAANSEYEYVLDKAELPLENCSVKEVRRPVEYTITLKYTDGKTEEVKFNVENRAEVRAELDRKLTDSTDEYDYSWKGGMPETLPLENLEYEVSRTAKVYTLTIDYVEKEDEAVTFTVETRAEVLASLAGKLTPSANGYTYAWVNLPKVLELKNQTITEKKTAVEYTLTVVYSDERKENEEYKFTVENRAEVYASLAGKLLASNAEYSYKWDKTELPLENVTVTEIKTAVEYTLTIKYTEKPDETLKYTVENKDEVLISLADKLTADSAAYTYGWDKTELNLEDTTITEQRTANEYTLTVKYADKAAETIKFTVETRDSVLASVKAKLTPSTEDYEYSWKNLPEELKLKNQTIEEEKKAIQKPTPTPDSSDSGNTTETGDDSGAKKGCGSSVFGGSILGVLGLFAAAMAIKKKKD